MTPSCQTCHWWADEERNGVPVERITIGVQKVCIVWPVHVETAPLHRCGQFRLAERLCGGADARTRT